MKNQLVQLILLHLREFVREPGVLFWGVFFPVLMAWGLGIAFTEQRETISKVAVIKTTLQNENADPKSVV